MMDKDQLISEMSNVVYFLLWFEEHDPNAVYGGICIAKAIDSLAKLHGLPPDQLRALIDINQE